MNLCIVQVPRLRKDQPAENSQPNTEESADEEIFRESFFQLRKSCDTPLFNRLRISRFDPFCLEKIRCEHGTTTVLLQWLERLPLERSCNSQRPSKWYLPCGLRRGGLRVRRYLWQAVKHCVGGRVIPLWPGCQRALCAVS